MHFSHIKTFALSWFVLETLCQWEEMKLNSVRHYLKTEERQT
jgi:hypothetical protein